MPASIDAVRESGDFRSFLKIPDCCALSACLDLPERQHYNSQQQGRLAA
jgi:hypothetical protein